MGFKEFSKERFYEKGWLKVDLINEGNDINTGKDIAKKLKLIFNGYWEEMDKWTFTDAVSQNTFTAKDFQEAEEKINKIRNKIKKD